MLSRIDWHRELLRRDNEAVRDVIQKEIERLLAAKEFDGASIDRFLNRDYFPLAADQLARECRPRARRGRYSSSALPILLDRYVKDFVLLFRLAVEFGTIHSDSRRFPKLNLNRLRRSEPGRMALLAHGEAIAPFHELSRRERAAFLLGKLSRAFLERM